MNTLDSYFIVEIYKALKSPTLHHKTLDTTEISSAIQRDMHLLQQTDSRLQDHNCHHDTDQRHAEKLCSFFPPVTKERHVEREARDML